MVAGDYVGMKIPEDCRRAKGLYKLLSGVNFKQGQDLKRQIVEAGGRDGTMDEVVIKFCAYVAYAEGWGPHSLAEYPFLGSFDGAMDVTDELKGLKREVKVGE